MQAAAGNTARVQGTYQYESPKMPSPLLQAVLDGDAVAVETLLAEDSTSVAVNSTDEELRLSLLGWAAYLGDRDMAGLLIRFGALLEAKDVGGRTPLLWAAAEGNAVVVELLIESGANVEAVTQSGNTPLSRAAAYGHVEVARVLLNAGARVECRNREGLTPLHRACRWGHPELAEALVAAGASVDAIDGSSMTPRDWAVRKGHSNIVPLLVQQSRPTRRSVAMDSPAASSGPPRKNSTSSFDSGLDSVLGGGGGSSASSFAAAATAVRPQSIMVTAPVRVREAVLDRRESLLSTPMEDPVSPAASNPDGTSDDGSPWSKLSFFGRRASLAFRPRHVEGYMNKRGGLVKSWKLRYCVLTENKLFYFGRQGERKARGTVELFADTIVEQNLQIPKEFCFNIVTRARTFLFQTKDAAEMEVWMTAIAHNVSGLGAT